MAKIEDGEIGNYINDNLQSDNENDDDLLPITTKKHATKEKKTKRKRSASLPFIEDHKELYKGLVANNGLQLMKAKESYQSTWTRKEWEDDFQFDAEMTDSPSETGAEKSSTRRSSSMPKFYHFSEKRKDEPSKQSTAKTAKSRSSRQRNTVIIETDHEANHVEQQEGGRFKLPVISNSVSSKTTQDKGNEFEALNQTKSTALNMKIQRKTYLPRINSSSGSIFMKSK